MYIEGSTAGASLKAGDAGNLTGAVYGGAFTAISKVFSSEPHQTASNTQIISQPQIINNTISGNSATSLGGGIYTTNSQAVVMNSILWGDAASNGPEIYVSGGSIVVRYSDVQGGWPGEGNIDVNPFFTNTSDYQLSDSSLCIGAGIDSMNIGGIWYYAPPTDMGGNPRPNPTGTFPDLGAWESDFIVGIRVSESDNIPKTYSLRQNYPNPFNPTTAIAYQVPQQSGVRIDIYNTLGQKVRTMINERKFTRSFGMAETIAECNLAAVFTCTGWSPENMFRLGR
jgi:predicted outer membrane repeat protein